MRSKHQDRQNLLLKMAILKRFRSQTDFAHALHIRDELVSRVICGRRSIPAAEIARWSKVLGVDISGLMQPSAPDNQTETEL